MSQSQGSQATSPTVDTTSTATTTSTTAPRVKSEKKTDKVLNCLRQLAPGKFATIEDLQKAVLGLTPEQDLASNSTAEQRNVIQSTVSQMVAKGKVHKQKTLRRMPGYCLPAAKPVTPTT